MILTAPIEYHSGAHSSIEHAMRRPQIIVLALDEWLARQLATLCEEHRWALADVRQVEAARALVAADRIAVLIVQVDPAVESSPALAFVASIAREWPDTGIIVVSDGKLSDDDRGLWSASVMDLGAHFVLFPPLTAPILEDLAGGLMAARLALHESASPAHSEAVIDLAEEGVIDS
jgi:hypothetical protein